MEKQRDISSLGFKVRIQMAPAPVIRRSFDVWDMITPVFIFENYDLAFKKSISLQKIGTLIFSFAYNPIANPR
jgi:hypothetical protein